MSDDTSEGFAAMFARAEQGVLVLAIGIKEFFHMAVADWGLIIAAGVMVTIPDLIAGWGAGGLKG